MQCLRKFARALNDKIQTMSQLNFNRLRNDVGESVVYDVVPDSERVISIGVA